jgi:hypothetical protein
MSEDPIPNPIPPALDPPPVNDDPIPVEGDATAQAAMLGGALGVLFDLTGKLENADMPSYLMLRQGIDLFMAAALGYYRSGKTVAARAARAQDVQGQVILFANSFPADNCGPTERRLPDGTCVPKTG